MLPVLDCMYEQMAEALAVHPAYKNIYGILYTTPKKKLLSLQDKLNSMSTKCAKLLQVMILNTLRQEDKAQVPLTTLGTDQTALHISNKIKYSEVHHNFGNNFVAPHDPDVLITVARIYTLLVKENFCAESARNQAYQLAIEASRSGDKVSLHNLLSESLHACGVHSFNSTGLNAPLTLKSIPNVVTAPSSPVLIPRNRRDDDSSAATALGSLHPFSSMASFSSNLEISQSPTVEFFSRPALYNHKHNHIESSKLCQDIPSGPVQHSEDEDDLGVENANEEDEAVQEPSMLSAHNQPLSQVSEVSCSHPSTDSGSETSACLPTSYRFPVECTNSSSTSQHVMPTDEPKKGKGQSTDMTSAEVPSSTEIAQSSPSSTVPPADDSTGLQHNIDSSATPLLTEIAGSERTFFSFVILHAKRDEAIALNVRDTLKSFGIPDGTTYCEEFEIPGHSPITCIEDAVDNSAFTILLLTSRFVSHWARLQTNAVLMNSINKKHKFNSVIPFLPKEDPLKEIPMVLNSIVPLNEKLSTFPSAARNTFKQKSIQKMKAVWKQEEEVRELQRRNKETEEQVKYCQKKNAATLELSFQQLKLFHTIYNIPPSHFPGPQQPVGMQPTPGAGGGFPTDYSQNFPSVSSLPPQMAYMPYPLNGMPFQPGYLQHFSDAQGIQYASGGTQPVIQIQHARNVQIGDHNQMRIVQTEEEKDSLNGTDSESDCVS